MPVNALKIPPKVALKVMADLKAYHAERNRIRRDAIAAEAIARVNPYMPKGAKPLRIPDMKQLFDAMRDEA